MSGRVVVESLPGRERWAVTMGGRLYAAGVVIIVGQQVHLPDAVEVAEVAPAQSEHPADAALRSVFRPGSRVALLGTAGTVERADSPTLRAVRLDGGGLAEGVELREMRAL